MNVLYWNTWTGCHPEFRSFLPDLRDSDVMCFSEVHNASHSHTPEYCSAPNAQHRQSKLWVKQYTGMSRMFRNTHQSRFFLNMHALHDAAEHNYDFQFGNSVHWKNSLGKISAYGQCIHGIEPKPAQRGYPARRTAQAIVIDDGEKIHVIAHFHGIWENGVGKIDTKHRIRQSEQVILFIRNVLELNDHSGLETSVVLGGDFNLMTGTDSLNMLVESDVFGKSGGILLTQDVNDTRTSLYPRNRGTRQADHVICSQTCSNPRLRVIREVPSDHALLSLEYN